MSITMKYKSDISSTIKRFEMKDTCFYLLSVVSVSLAVLCKIGPVTLLPPRGEVGEVVTRGGVQKLPKRGCMMRGYRRM